MLNKLVATRISNSMDKRLQEVLIHDFDGLYEGDVSKFLRAAISRHVQMEEGKRLLRQRSLK